MVGWVERSETQQKAIYLTYGFYFFQLSKGCHPELDSGSRSIV